MKRRYCVAVVGDINLDISLLVPQSFLGGAEGDSFAQMPMRVTPAGTALSFARKAADFFAEVHLFGRIGGDWVGDALVGGQEDEGVTMHVTRDPSRPSRLVLILREAVPTGPGRRVMISSADAANSWLGVADLEELVGGDVAPDVVLFDGYSCLEEPSRETVGEAARALAAAGRRLAFDVVPHDLHGRWSLGALRGTLKSFHIVIAEAATLARFVGHSGQVSDVADVVGLLPLLRREFGPKVFLLRFGVGQIGESMIVWEDGEYRVHSTGYADVEDPAGFGDRLTASELVEVLDRIGVAR